MKWAPDAEQAIKKVPFFVRGRVRKKTESYVSEKGGTIVSLSHVNALKQRFLSKGGMEKDIKGYDVSACFGGSGCPNSACSGTQLAADIGTIFKQADLLSFLKHHVKGDLKFHHEFQVVISDCPNACSRPQIADIGIIGASMPEITHESCTQCLACADACTEGAVLLDDQAEQPFIREDLCLLCGKCIQACPTGTIRQGKKGFRVLLGGRLGRHPRLALPVTGIQTHDQVIDIVKKAILFYKQHSSHGKRFSHLLTRVDPVLNTRLGRRQP